MAGPPNKKQKREDYRTARENGEESKELPKKKFYRQRAHANPFSDHRLAYPASPAQMDWASHYPAYAESPTASEGIEETSEVCKSSNVKKMKQDVEVADIGCGFGGLTVALAPKLPNSLILGTSAFCPIERIKALRVQEKETGLFQNASCIRANTMKFMPNFFKKHQLAKIFLCFPDPHFKARKHKARIVSTTLAAEYAYVVRPGGIIYTITDVEDLHNWMVTHFNAHPTFERVLEEEQEADECVNIMRTETEEGKKVTRNNGPKFVALFKRLEDPPW
ncbi:hypothetical protein SS1G_14425 [Sclerotinia sclerotiorum 1980 UF-70]|uniref:tRNA (guanine-N(7)-)-methyltransferase n=1 Tax=Sclerotinia sclerotiorum (strain ATCC 18683 / 1980 / Ss-1) TaxID=665079 RepID=A7F9Z4_SCLS1|nr:hypothetical protein SS1G_14425 [Sclerotinia sclerotiorum 1980 UF-70]EDO00555.1 hypothetical protein SS1G_14425 [Sclerotinia sclerotiorum 1980 UF-70]